MREFRGRVAITFPSRGALSSNQRLRLRRRNQRPRARGLPIRLLPREHPVRRLGEMSGHGPACLLMSLAPRHSLVEAADVAPRMALAHAADDVRASINAHVRWAAPPSVLMAGGDLV